MLHKYLYILPADIFVGIIASVLDNIRSTYVSHNMNTYDWKYIPEASQRSWTAPGLPQSVTESQ